MFGFCAISSRAISTIPSIATVVVYGPVSYMTLKVFAPHTMSVKYII